MSRVCVWEKIGICAALLFITGLLVPLRAPAQTRPAGIWVNVTANVGGPKWGFAGVTTMAAVPGTDQVIAGVSEAGLWLSADRGKSWTNLGAQEAVPIRSRPYQITFDPADPQTFWVSGNYESPGLFKTADGGKTFTPFATVKHIDGVGIDFTDPQRKTIIVGHHELSRGVDKTADAGQTWQTIGQKLPDNTNFSNDVIVLDSATYIVNAAGWKKDATFGIYRTEDGGATWTKVSDAGPGGPACVTRDGAIYWQTLWAKGLIKSTDKGKTWQTLAGPVKENPIELPDGRLVAPVDKQLYSSTDAGKTWQPLGPELPFKPSGICFSEKGKAIYAWRSTEAKEDGVIVKWEMGG